MYQLFASDQDHQHPIDFLLRLHPKKVISNYCKRRIGSNHQHLGTYFREISQILTLNSEPIKACDISQGFIASRHFEVSLGS